MALIKGYKQMLDEAQAKIQTLSADEAKEKLGHPDVLFVDIRDVHELERGGTIPGAFHAPRGVLEFWVDPESPYFRPAFGEDKQFVLFCQSGWRSALAASTLQDMGLTRVSIIAGGYKGWKESGGVTAAAKARS